jgi:hypothetical protein
MKRWFLVLVLAAFGAAPAFADNASRKAAIAGPVIPLGSGPWGMYENTEAPMAREIADSMLNYLPQYGTKLSGTFDLNTAACNITLTGAGASGVSSGDYLLANIAIDSGTGTGPFVFYVGSVAGSVITSSTQCGQIFVPSQTGLEVYQCTTQCRDQVLAGGGPYAYYTCGTWLICALEPGSNFYDMTKALYHLWQRTGLTADHTRFDDYCQAQWKWIQGSGYKYATPPRGHMLTGLYICALDGHTDYLPGLYRLVYTYYTTDPAFLYPSQNGVSDLREGGITLNNMAVGARADSDSTRHANYCAKVSQIAQAWVDIYDLEGTPGHFNEKNLDFAYTVNGFSAWRSAVGIIQALARSYDVLIDTDTAEGGCNDPTTAANVMAVLEETVPYLYTSSYEPGARGVYYDTNQPANGVLSPGWLAGTVSIGAGSTTVTGSGTSFLTDFNCDNTDYIGISYYEGGFDGTITVKVASCASNTQLTLAAPLSSQCYYYYNGSTFPEVCGGAAASGKIYRRAEQNTTTCTGTVASYCFSPDKNSARDLPWIFGWMYNKTGDSTYITQGDVLFATAAGGPGDGAGGSEACSGPNCWSTNTDWIASLHGCASDPTLPCNPDTNYATGSTPLNVYVAGSKRYAQFNGQGGGDNYLAWRVSGGGSSFGGKVTFSGEVRF